MTADDRIEQAFKVIDTGAMMQFDKNSQFAQALRDLVAEVRELRSANSCVGDEPVTTRSL